MPLREVFTEMVTNMKFHCFIVNTHMALIIVHSYVQCRLLAMHTTHFNG